jgi:hypothetical protein
MLILLAALVAVHAPAVDAPAPDPSTPAETASAVLDCWRAVGPDSVDRKVLAAAGWTAVPVSPGEGPLTPFIKAGANPLILLADAKEASMLCTVVTRVTAPAQQATVLSEVRKLLQGVAPDIKLVPEGETAVLVSLPRVALVDRWVLGNGANQKPGMRIIIDYKIAEKK